MNVYSENKIVESKVSSLEIYKTVLESHAAVHSDLCQLASTIHISEFSNISIENA